MAAGNMGWDDAQDAAQETLIGAWRSRAPWRGECALEGWLRGILWHKVQDRRRARWRDLTVMERGVASGAIIATLVELDPDRRVVDGLPTPADLGEERPVEDGLILQADDAAVWIAMDQLPPHYQRVLQAKYLCGWSVDEIARKMGVSYSAAESLLTRARVAFREVYREVECA
jgi:RNA polymerase sigma-70 factor (ECF subfamily)